MIFMDKRWYLEDQALSFQGMGADQVCMELGRVYTAGPFSQLRGCYWAHGFDPQANNRWDESQAFGDWLPAMAWVESHEFECAEPDVKIKQDKHASTGANKL